MTGPGYVIMVVMNFRLTRTTVCWLEPAVTAL